MKISVNYSDGVMSLPKGVLKDLGTLSAEEMKVILYICRDSGAPDDNFSLEDAARELQIEEKDVENALAFWRGTGYIKLNQKGQKAKSAKAPSKDDDKIKTAMTKKTPEGEVEIITNRPPQYSGEEIDRIVSKNDAVKRLKEECESENILNRPMRAAELNMIIALYDYFGFDEAYILQLLSISSKMSHPVKYAYSVGVSNFNKNIVTYEGLLDELQRIEEAGSYERRIKKLFGIDGRSLSTREKKFFSEWMKFDFELVKYAYDQTVDSTGKASMPYMNKILTTFAEKGITTPEMAQADKKSRDSAKSREGFDERGFFDIALEGSYKKGQKKEDGDEK